MSYVTGFGGCGVGVWPGYVSPEYVGREPLAELGGGGQNRGAGKKPQVLFEPCATLLS